MTESLLVPGPAPCRACADGRAGPWSELRAGGVAVLLDGAPLAARRCDRCGAVEIRQRAQRSEPAKAAARPPAPGSALFHGLLQNLAAAASELVRAVRKPRAP